MSKSFCRVFSLALLAVFCCPQLSFSQAFVNQIIVVNGGVFGDPSDNVTLATVQPDLSGYSVFAEIGTEAAQDLALREDRAWVSALDSLVAFDIDLYSRVAAIALPGVNKIEPFGDYLLVGRGFGASADFLQIRNAEDLSLISNLPVSAETGRMALSPDRAYVAVPGDFFSSTGKLAVVDLVNGALIKEIDLGTDGDGIDALFLERGRVLALCEGSGKLLVIDPETETWSSITLGAFSTYPGAVRNDDLLYFQYGGFFDANLGVFDLSSQNTLTDSLIGGGFAEIQVNPLNGDLYRTTTDFFSTGTLYHHDGSGVQQASIAVGVSAEHLGMDIRGNCLPPLGIVIAADSTSAAVSWNAAGTATSYRLFGRETGTGAVSSIPVSSTGYTLTGLDPGSSYELAIKSLCGTGSSGFSAVQSFNTLTSSPAMRDGRVGFWQSSTHIGWDHPQSGGLEFQLLNMAGSILQSGYSKGPRQLSLEDLPSGQYLLRLEGHAFEHARPFTIVR